MVELFSSRVPPLSTNYFLRQLRYFDEIKTKAIRFLIPRFWLPVKYEEICVYKSTVKTFNYHLFVLLLKYFTGEKAMMRTDFSTQKRFFVRDSKYRDDFICMLLSYSRTHTIWSFWVCLSNSILKIYAVILSIKCSCFYRSYSYDLVRFSSEILLLRLSWLRSIKIISEANYGCFNTA